MAKHEHIPRDSKGGEALYSEATRKKFEKEYGKKKGDEVWRKEVGIQFRRAHGGRNWNQKRRRRRR